MGVYVRIPRRPNSAPTYKWEKYIALHTWTCSEYVKFFKYYVYEAIDGQPQYDHPTIRIEWLDNPFDYNGISPDNQLEYYEYSGDTKEELVDMYPVESSDRNAYPDYGSSEDDSYHVYYYQFNGSEKGMYTGETVTSKDENAYPNNGLHTDGYWYVKI